MIALKSSGRVTLPSGLAVVSLIALVVTLLCTSAPSASAQTLTTLVSFNGSDGTSPSFGSLASDANGNLFGTTQSGGPNGDGVVFEIAKTAGGYASTPTIVAGFDGTHGAFPLSGLIADANGNLLGTTQSGGASGNGTVFEIAKTSTGYASVPTILVNFGGNDGAFPQASLTADANGNLFGTTFQGGAYGAGTVFEIVNNNGVYATIPTTLVSFDGNNGALPVAGLIADSNGDLFGTTLAGGASGSGTVFEVANTASGYDGTPITLVSFDGATAGSPFSGLIADANGDLFGTTNAGGTYGYGTVFEIVNTTTGYSSTPTILVNFQASDGAAPVGGLIADATGTLFGTTDLGGEFGNGTVFKIVQTTSGFASAPTTLINFDGADGANPYSSLIADANGNLFGTTLSGGASNDGTAFVITGSGFVPPKQFAGTPGAPNCAGESISTLAHTYGGAAHAAASLGYASTADLQSAVASYCSQ